MVGDCGAAVGEDVEEDFGFGFWICRWRSVLLLGKMILDDGDCDCQAGLHELISPRDIFPGRLDEEDR